MNRANQLANLKRLLENGKKKPPSPFYTFKATEKRARLAGRMFRQAYENDAIVAWHSAVVPSEIFHALGIIPFYPGSVSAMLASSGFVSKVLHTSNANSYLADICSFSRFTIGAVLDNFFPMPDIIVCANYHCDNSSQTFNNLGKIYGKKPFFLDIPHECDSNRAIDFLSEQLQHTFYEMAKDTGCKVDNAKLSEIIDNSNKAREHYLRINELRKSVPAPIHGAEAIDFSAIVANTWGLPEIVEVYKLLEQELEERVKNKVGAVPGERFRIFWRHLRQYYLDDIFIYMTDKWKAVIVFEELNYLHWDKLDPNDPFKSLAKKILSDPAVGCVERWGNVDVNLVENYKADGVIAFCNWGCRHLSSVL